MRPDFSTTLDRWFDVTVTTRYHQASIVLAPLLALPLIFLLGPRIGIWALPIALVATVLLPAFVYACWPRRDALHVGTDGLVFKRGRFVPFVEITRFGTGDYLRIDRYDAPTLLVGCRLGREELRALEERFQASLRAWERFAPPGTPPVPGTPFYGSGLARVIGVLLCLGGCGALIFSLMAGSALAGTAWFLVTLTVAIPMLLGGRP
ncbi:hypothetical protein [Stenotrophomonas sp. 24(2023)]|uniref:hypothetical protein n=1 Tax=Stenotrophomonas sp. 24(2023) TaxID=3068324 RepID=UPI0027E1422A|nr:hypothetical protein [Stenotrophomonas sp. 24(2023)]WMJ68806.1 hypothetical protein Q9R17_16715 [Stenotrophomonas sp. 24(2023)]